MSTALDGDEFEKRVIAYLGSKLPQASDLSLVDLQRIAVGWSHETWLFDLHYTEYKKAISLPLCLRRDPGNALLRELSDLEEQFRVLKCLESTQIASPKAYWFESDPEILGSSFLVMEKVQGSCPSPWGKDGRKYYAEASERGNLPRSFVETLATLHTADWAGAGLGFLGVPASGKDFAQREITKWKSLIETSDHRPEPILTDLICHLENNIPSTSRHSLVHGAYRTGNLLIQDDEISAVLDWELQVIGDPLYDVAYVLSDLNREGTELLSNLVERELFFEQYQALTGIEIDEDVCKYYNALYAMRSVAFWMSASGLYATGKSDDIRLARTAWSVPVVLERAAKELGY